MMRARWIRNVASERLARLARRGGFGGLLVIFAIGYPGGVPSAAARAPQDASSDPAQTALRTSRYDDAIAAFEQRVRSGAASVDDHIGLVRALSQVGRYDDAEEAARDYIDANPGSPELSNSLGELLYLQGKILDARVTLERAIAEEANDRLMAELNLAILDFNRGDRNRAMQRFDRVIDVYNASSSLTAEELVAVGIACTYLGIERPVLFHDAVRAFEEAIAADPGNPEPQLRLAELFLTKYNSTDADDLLTDVLEMSQQHPRALLGLARRMQFDGAPGSLQVAQRAIEINPRLVAGHLFLAEQFLSLENYGEAVREVESALEVNPASLEALALLAAARYLHRDEPGFQRARARALSLNPSYADLYNTLADVCVQNRLYAQAVEFATSAIEIDSSSWRGYGLLGINQMRIRAIEDGRENLEIAFAGDPYNVWVKNTLDLLDTFPDYVASETARFEIMIEAEESELLSLYLGELAEEAYDNLAERYGYQPPTPIRIEVYPSHADFSVRTVGLAGLGALGVSFGPVIAIDSPSARTLGEFNWGSTLWHEIGHTFTLGMTDQRIPRWLSEGLSVYEERRARPGWGDDTSASFLIAYHLGQLLPVSHLTDGFMRPSYPQQVVHSYYQASLVCELIERDHGFAALLAILEGYKNGSSTAQIFRDVLGVEPEEFDATFEQYLEEQFAGPLAALEGAVQRMDRDNPASRGARLSADEMAQLALEDPNDFVAQLGWGVKLYEEERDAEAVTFLERSKELFPEFGGAGPAQSPYWYLAMIAHRAGNKRKAANELSALIAINEKHLEAHVLLADLLDELGDHSAAADALSRTNYIFPLEIRAHSRLAELYAKIEEHEGAVRERRAVVALDPVDRAEALYELAFAHYRADDTDEAKLQVLGALEIAPSFEKAQKLLLTLVGRETEGRRP